MQRADVVVIGGGIVGCACAYFLSRAGLKVVLLEKDAVAGATSGCCMGHLMVVPRPEPIYRLTHRSVQLWREFITEVGGFDHNLSGVLYLAEKQDDLQLLRELEQTFASYGDSSELLSPQELLRREPHVAADLLGALFYAEDGIVMPTTAAGRMLEQAMAMGAQVRPHTQATGLRRGADGSVQAVQLARGEIATPAVVNAAGVWAPQIAAWAGLDGVPIFPRRGDLAITMPHDLPIKHALLEVSYLRTATGKPVDPEGPEDDPGACALNVQPQSNNTLLIGSTRQFAGYQRQVNQQLLCQSLQRAARFVPAVLDLQVLRTWAGLRPYTRDNLPIIGAVPNVPGLFMAAGHEGLGITLSMVTGELISQAVRGEQTSLDLSPCSLARFAESPSSHA